MSRHAAGTAIAFACAAWAAVGPASDAVPQAAVGVPERPEPPNLAVLRNGDIVEGSIRFAQGGYEVAAKGGRIFLADSMIWFTARHRREAYEELRKRAPCRTADEHVGLARWCERNRLYSCAKDELAVALEQEPGHVEARSLAARLERGIEATAKPAVAADPAADGAETLGGLPPDAAADYVTRIQPLLVNRCSNAACHGPAAGNAFRLSVVRPGSPAFRRLSEANLESVRRQISADGPETSPLIAEARRVGHGNLRKPMFPGPAGEAQIEVLAAWAAKVAKSSRPEAPAVEPTTPPTPFRLAAASEAEPGETVSADAEEAAQDATNALLRKAIAGEGSDAFDPQEFNRLYGPGADRRLSPLDRGPTR